VVLPSDDRSIPRLPPGAVDQEDPLLVEDAGSEEEAERRRGGEQHGVPTLATDRRDRAVAETPD